MTTTTWLLIAATVIFWSIMFIALWRELKKGNVTPSS